MGFMTCLMVFECFGIHLNSWHNCRRWIIKNKNYFDGMKFLHDVQKSQWSHKNRGLFSRVHGISQLLTVIRMFVLYHVLWIFLWVNWMKNVFKMTVIFFNFSYSDPNIFRVDNDFLEAGMNFIYCLFRVLLNIFNQMAHLINAVMSRNTNLKPEAARIQHTGVK